MIFAELEAAASLFERLIGFVRRRNARPDKENLSTRFIQLFESHGIHRNQIPRVFGHDLSVADCQSAASLIAKLNEPILSDACELLGARREWLDGASRQIYPTYDFYKQPSEFKKFLSSLVSSNDQIIGVLLSPSNISGEAWALLLLEETVGYIGDKPYFRYHICKNWRYPYWKCRAHLTACIATCWSMKVYVHGLGVKNSTIESLMTGESLLGWNGGGVYSEHGRPWHAEDLVNTPDVFIKELNPEENNFGIKSALKLWLDLDSEGYMNYGAPGTNVRTMFEEKLEQYIG